MKKILLYSFITLLVGCEHKPLKKLKFEIEQERYDSVLALVKRTDSIKDIEKAKADADYYKFVTDTYILDSINERKLKIKITKISGRDEYDGSTKITYISNVKIVAQKVREAKGEMKTATEIKEIRDFYIHESPGGEIYFDIIRDSDYEIIEGNYTYIVKNNKGEEIRREDTHRSHPYKLYDGNFSGGTTIVFYKKVEMPLYVFVVDKFYHKTFKFKIDVVKK